MARSGDTTLDVSNPRSEADAGRKRASSLQKPRDLASEKYACQFERIAAHSSRRKWSSDNWGAPLNFEDESYVRLYTADTASWSLLGWEGQTVLMHMLRGRFDRAGVFDCGRHGPARAIAAVTKLPAEIVEIGLRAILDEGTWVVNGTMLVWPKYVEAQTCKRADRVRQQESRRNRRQSSLPWPVDPERDMSRTVTDRHDLSQQSQASQSVTPNQADPSLAKQSDLLSSSESDAKDEIQPAESDATTAECRKVFTFWQKEHGHEKAKFDSKRKNKIRARLRDKFTVRELCLAIRGAKRDPWLMGTDPKAEGKVYDDITVFLRDTPQVERLIALSGAPRKRPDGLATATLKRWTDPDAQNRDRYAQPPDDIPATLVASSGTI